MATYRLLNFSLGSSFLAHGLADFMRLKDEAMTARGKFQVLLSGGSTPKPFYEALAQSGLDWSKIHIYFSDERYVAQGDSLSNFGMIQKALLSHIVIPSGNIHPIHTHFADPHEAARLYEVELESVRFDLSYLGIGQDGHTASLFPGILIPGQPKVAAFYVPKLGGYRISLLPNILNESREIRFLVSGAQKKPVVDYILQDPEPAYRYPCQLIRSCEIWAY